MAAYVADYTLVSIEPSVVIFYTTTTRFPAQNNNLAEPHISPSYSHNAKENTAFGTGRTLSAPVSAASEASVNPTFAANEALGNPASTAGKALEPPASTAGKAPAKSTGIAYSGPFTMHEGKCFTEAYSLYFSLYVLRTPTLNYSATHFYSC